MSRKKIKYIHLFVWLFAIFANLPYASMGQGVSSRQAVTYLFAFLYLMVVFYLFYLVLVPRYLEKRRMGIFFLVSFTVALVMPFFGYTVLFLIRAVADGSFEHFYRGYSFSMHMSGYFPVLIAAVFGSFFRVIINWFTTLSQNAELDRQRIAAELELHKSRLNSHFLFNTLNNIDSLIREDPERASSELIKLSDMMRYLTYEAAADKVKLKREADLLGDFIELNRIRLIDPGSIEFEIHGDLSLEIAPSLFLPLVENAFKFATFRLNKPGIRILLHSENGIINFETWNYYDSKSVTSNGFSGLGIANLRRRLELTCPGKHTLVTEAGEMIFHVKLTIDNNADKMHSHR